MGHNPNLYEGLKWAPNIDYDNPAAMQALWDSVHASGWDARVVNDDAASLQALSGCGSIHADDQDLTPGLI